MTNEIMTDIHNCIEGDTDKKGLVNSSRTSIKGLIRKMGFVSDWEKHLEQMNHSRYPYFDVHQEALDKYGLNPNLEPNTHFCNWKYGPNHNSILKSLNGLENHVKDKLTLHRKESNISEYIPHFIAVRENPSMFYLLSYPYLERGFDVDRYFAYAFRSMIANWLSLRGGSYVTTGQTDHPDKLYPATQFQSNLCGYLAYGVDILNRESEEEDKKFERPVYQYNKERIFRLVSDTSDFCRIARADYDTINVDKHNKFWKVEHDLSNEIESIAQSLAFSAKNSSGLIQAISRIRRTD